MIRPVLVFILFFLPAAFANAQLLKYNSKEEIREAAMVSPDSTPQIIEKLVKECSHYGQAIESEANQALLQWLGHHQSLIDENLKVRQEVLSSAKTDSEKRQLKRMLETQLPQMIEGQFVSISSVINAAPSKEAKERICRAYVESIKDGKWDLRDNDPVVYKFLQDRIAARAK